MKNRFEIVSAGTEIVLEDEFGNEFAIVVKKKTVIIYANGHHKKDWKIVIDKVDYRKVDKAVSGSWYVSVCKGTIYAKFCEQKNGARKYILMHRVITNCPTDKVVDHHPHHYGLDNRRCNLTNVTAVENNKNQIKGRSKVLNYKW